MQQNNFAQRFTDVEYLSKREITNVLGPSYVESAWRLTSDYREKYRFPLPLKRFDNFPFTVVLTPSIMAHANSAERKMIEYTLLFENLKVKESISDNKTLQKYKADILREDLLVLAHHADLEVGERDIDLMLEPQSMHLKTSHMYGIYEAIKYLNNDGFTYGLNRNLVRDIYNHVARINDTMINYRTTETYSGDISSLTPQDIQGAPTNRISEFMGRLFEFYDGNYELSPFIIGAVVYAYILYVIPFEQHSQHIALLLVEKILADAGYGEASYYTSISQYIIRNERKLKSAFENTRTTGDLTYVIVFICNAYVETLNWKVTTLQSVEVPIPVREDVKVVEKIVEVPTVKEVIKEVIKEVPVEKIVYVDRQVAAQQVAEKVLTQPTTSSTYGIQKIDIPPQDDEDNQTNVYRDYQKPEPKQRSAYDFIDDPFAASLKPTQLKEEVKVEPKVIVPVKQVEPQNVGLVQVDNSMDMSEDVKKLLHLQPTELARAMIEINPLLRDYQALFYANHHDVGRYYTIGHFKNFTGCAYETARTSMDYLTSLGLYRKEQLKNKFVYTPTDLRKDS